MVRGLVVRAGPQQGIGESDRIEVLQIIDAFPDSHQSDRNPQFLVHGQDHTTLRGPVQFREDDSRKSQCLIELSGLDKPVLTGNSINDEKTFMGRARVLTLQYPAYLPQLLHEVPLRVEAACRVDKQHIGTLRPRRLEGIEGDSRSVGADLLFDQVRPRSIRPDGELLDGCSPESIRGGDHDVQTFLSKPTREFPDRRRLSGPVDAGDEDDPRRRAARPIHGLWPASEDFQNFLAKGTPDTVHFPNPVLPDPPTQPLEDAFTGGDSDIRLEEDLFEIVEQVVIDPGPTTEHSGKAVLDP